MLPPTSICIRPSGRPFLGYIVVVIVGVDFPQFCLMSLATPRNSTLFFSCPLFWDEMLLWSPGWPGTWEVNWVGPQSYGNPPAFSSQMLGLWACTITSGEIYCLRSTQTKWTFCIVPQSLVVTLLYFCWFFFNVTCWRSAVSHRFSVPQCTTLRWPAFRIGVQTVNK